MTARSFTFTVSAPSSATPWPEQGAVGYTPLVRNSRGLALNSVGGSGRAVGVNYSVGDVAPQAVTIRRVTYGTSNVTFGTNFRNAIAAHNAGTGPSLIVFDSSGTMDLNGQTASITRDGITIAGQTAPNPGVQYRNGIFNVRASDVLIQHLRGGYPEALPNTESFDGFRIQGTTAALQRIVVDHCAFMWCADSCGDVDATGPLMVESVAYLNSVFAEGLYTTTNTRLFIMGTCVREFLIYGCVLAHANTRQPRTKARRGSVVNCLYYNWGNYAWELDQPDGGDQVTASQRFNAVGNTYVRGLNDSGAKPIEVNSAGSVNPASLLYVNGNKVWNRTTDLATGQAAATQWADCVDTNGKTLAQSATALDWPTGLVEASADTARSVVLDYVGPRPGNRDPDITRLLNEITSGTGTHKTTADVLPPSYAVNSATFPANPTTGSWRDIVACSDGVNRTRLEKYLHDLEDAIL
jgi:hypothetical protein